MKQELSASKVFSSMAVFDMLRDQLHMVFYAITQLVTGKVSLNRVDDFLKNVCNPLFFHIASLEVQ